jgi:hypothetical protein
MRTSKTTDLFHQLQNPGTGTTVRFAVGSSAMTPAARRKRADRNHWRCPPLGSDDQ